MPKLNIKKVPTPNAISQRMSNIILVANDMAFQFPKVLNKKWMKPIMGMLITKIPAMDINMVVNGADDTVIQSILGNARKKKVGMMRVLQLLLTLRRDKLSIV